MADVDPELAFLESQKEYDPAGDYSNLAAEQPADEEEEDEYDPSAAFPSYPQQDAETPSAQSASMSPASTANSAPTATEDALKPPPVEPAAPSPAKQPRTMGGFVVESEDEEDEEPVSKPEAAGSEVLNAPGVSESHSPQRSLTHTPLNTLPSQTVPLHSAQDQENPSASSSSTLVTVNDTAPVLASAVSNAGTPVPAFTVPAAPEPLSVETAHQSAVMAPITPTTASLPKPRLAQDRVGILEDRIAEDPRGDIEAWLGLIEEHRRRHKHDEARAVYDRFFKVIPSAVGLIVMTPSLKLLIGLRPNNGLSTWIWSHTLMSLAGLSAYLSVRSCHAPMLPFGRRTSITSVAETLPMIPLAMPVRSLPLYMNLFSKTSASTSILARYG
jgi:cleavage stimulation factor subunit 3